MKNRAEPISKKDLVYTIEYRVDATEDEPNLRDILEKMRETGEAYIVDVRIEAQKAPA